jgi:hypothetical protein
MVNQMLFKTSKGYVTGGCILQTNIILKELSYGTVSFRFFLKELD